MIKQLYASTNTVPEQQIQQRRIPTTNNSSAQFEQEKSMVQITKDQLARNTQFSSAMKSTMREQETQVES